MYECQPIDRRQRQRFVVVGCWGRKQVVVIHHHHHRRRRGGRGAIHHHHQQHSITNGFWKKEGSFRNRNSAFRRCAFLSRGFRSRPWLEWRNWCCAAAASAFSTHIRSFEICGLFRRTMVECGVVVSGNEFVAVGIDRAIITTMLSCRTLLIYAKAFPLHSQWTQVWSRMSGLYMGEHRGFGRRFRRVGRRGQRI
jgi:hypothetical protein